MSVEINKQPFAIPDEIINKVIRKLQPNSSTERSLLLTLLNYSSIDRAQLFMYLDRDDMTEIFDQEEEPIAISVKEIQFIQEKSPIETRRRVSDLLSEYSSTQFVCQLTIHDSKNEIQDAVINEDGTSITLEASNSQLEMKITNIQAKILAFLLAHPDELTYSIFKNSQAEKISAQAFSYGLIDLERRMTALLGYSPITHTRQTSKQTAVYKININKKLKE